MRGRVVLACTLAAGLALAGCLTLVPAHVPNRLLEGPGGNGWARDDAHSQTEPTGGALSLARTQALVYRDAAGGGQGYPGELDVITVRALFTPSATSLRDQARQFVVDVAGKASIHLDDAGYQGERDETNRAHGIYFVYNGSVSSANGFFTQNAKMKILGEVFPCTSERTSVIAVALAQITNVRSIGGVPVGTNTDLTTWTEIVGDANGDIEGQRDVNGLVTNIACD